MPNFHNWRKINSTIFKQETIESWFSGVSTSVNNEVIQPFQNASSVIDKYNQAIQNNSLTQQGWERLLAQSDDSLKAYLTSVKGSTASMTAYNVSLQGSITGFSKVSSAVQQYNALGAISKKEQQEFATAVGLTNNKLGSYLIGLNGSNASLRGYGVSLVASTAKTIGLTVATTALNAAMTMGISVIVTGLISAFTAWINKSEEITEKAQEAADKINSISESLKTNTETVENAKRRYAELAQEVENLGKITQSQGTLDNEEYEEFLDLSNQLAGVFPSLTKNYDENGNAILDLFGDVNTIVGSLDDLIQKEKELANQQIMEKFPDVFKGYAQDVSEAESKVKSAQTEFDKINNAYQQLATHGSSSLAFDTTQTGEPFATFKNEIGEDVTIGINEYTQALDELGIAYKKSNLWKPNQFGGKDLVGTLIEATGDIDEAFTSKLKTARNNLQYAQQQLEGEKSSIDSYLNTWLQSEYTYSKIEDDGLKTAIQDMIFNFDWDNLPDGVNEDNWTEVSEYLRRNILFAISKVQNDPTISKALSEVFTNDDLTPDEKINYIKQIQDYFGEDNAITISLATQLEDNSPLQTLHKQYDSAIEQTKKQFKGDTSAATEALKTAQENLQDEYDKIEKWGLGDYAEQIKNGTIQSVFGNVDMDNRQVIDWTTDNIEKWKDALSDIKYYDEDGNFIDSYYDQLKESAENGESCIDTVFGDMMDYIEGYDGITALSFSHIVNNDDGTFEFLGRKTAEEYLYGILDAAKQDGDMSIDHILELDKKGLENAEVYDAEGKLIGQTYIHGIISGFNENANDISMLTHFAGDFGAVNLAKQAIEEAEKMQEDFDWDSWFKENSINTKEEIDNWLEIAQATNSAAEARKRYVQGSTLDNEAVFSDIFSFKNAEGELNNLGKISESIDTIQKAYKTLNDAIDEYNENGSFSIDTLQSVIELGDDWLDYLVDEEGNLQLDKESLQQLTQSRLEDLRVQTINNLIDNVSKIKTDADANTYLASTNYALKESYEEVAKEALKTAEAQMQAAVAAKTLTQANMDAAMSKATADIAKINKLFNNVDVTSVSSLSGGSKSGGSKSTQKEYEELFDFFERRIDVLNNSLDLLKANLENVNGSFAKNQLIDAQSSIYQEEIKNYTDALNMYQQKANEVLATLPDDIAEKIKNGSISLTTFMGESSEAVVDAMKDYEGWSDKIADCNQKLAELKESLRDLELEKFNNIIEGFTQQFDLRQTGIDNIDKQIAVFEEAGMLVGKSFYQAQKEQASKQLDILKKQQMAMANQLSSALSSGNIETGTDEWLEMVSELQNVEGSILDCEKAIEEFDNAILDLHWQVFERIQDQFSNLDSELDNLIGLLDDIDVADTSGNWTTDSITKLGLLSQQYELAQHNVAEYNKAIEELKEQYANGEYSAIEYTDKLAELSDGMWENANAVEAVKDAIMDLHEARVDKEIEGIEEEIEAYNELIQAKIDELDAEKELNDYRNSISQKSKSITDLERQIAAMSNDTTSATIAQRKKLEEQLAEAKKELEDAEYDHSIQSQKDALNKQFEDYEKTRNEEIEALKDSLNNQEKLIAESFETVKQNASTIGQQISNIAKQHGVQVSNTLTSSWQAGENAIAAYGTVLSAQSSAFIDNIIGVENEVWDLQAQADNTANSLAWMFSTQADNLVNELIESANAEWNLQNMTNALQSSLVNALERGYDISGITTALKGIESAANSAGSAIDKLFDKQNAVSGYTYQSAGSSYGSNVVRVSDSNGKLVTITTKEDAEKKYGATLKKYAKGTRNSKGNLIVKDEQGYELVLPKLASGKYAIENEGSQILTKVETDNIFDWAKFNPDMFIPNFANNFATSIPHIASKNVNNVAPSVNVGNLITVQGNVDSSNIKQMEIIANKAVNNLVDKMYNGKKYGSY